MTIPEVYLDPTTPHHYGDRLFEAEGNQFLGDNILTPFIVLRQRLTELGFRVHTADAIPHAEEPGRRLLISFGVPDRLISLGLRRYRTLARRRDITLSAFVSIECPVVEPRMYRALPELARCFRRVLSWSDTPSLLPFTGQPVTVERFWWPQSFDSVHERLWERKRDGFLVLMNANKLPRLYRDELYTARLEAVRFFHAFGEIDLYGRNWDRAPMRVGKTATPYALRRAASRFWEWRQHWLPDPLYRAVAAASRGPAQSKSDTISRYRFAICFENSILRGWVTEKIFDCFFAGTVPVYWGAPDIQDWVPTQAFIDFRNFSGFEDLRRYLHSMDDRTWQEYRDAARAFLASPAFTRFRHGTFVDRLCNIIREDACGEQPHGSFDHPQGATQTERA